MSKIFFKEKQAYNSKRDLIILGAIDLIIVAKAIIFISSGNYYNASFLLVIASMIGASIWWLTRLKMNVTISDKNIKFKIYPLHDDKLSISWKEVEKCEIVETSEAAQWAGGNITFNQEKRFSFTGRNGLAIKTKKGDYYFIGCRQIGELQTALRKMEIWKKEVLNTRVSI